MSNIDFLRMLGILSWPLYRFFPDAYFALYSFYKRQRDSYKLTLLPFYIKPGDRVLDIGAHIGFYSRECARLAGRKGKVYAFEPDPINFKFLLRNTRDFSQLDAFCSAISSATGVGQLFRSKTLNVDHRMYGQGLDSETVETVSLDDFVKKNGQAPNFIKLDIQGYEFEALSGARQTLAAYHPAILTEFWPWGLGQAGSSPQALITLLESYAYKLFLVDEKKRALIPFQLSNLTQKESDYYDLICHA